MARALTQLLPLLAFAATAGCGTFKAADWAPVKRVQIGGSETTASDGYYADASAAIVAGDYGRALDLLQMARRGHEHDPRILNAFGVVYDKLGRFDLSARYYAQALAIEPDSPIVKGNLAYSDQLQQQWRTQNDGSGAMVVAQPPTPPPPVVAAAPILPPAAPANPAATPPPPAANVAEVKLVPAAWPAHPEAARPLAPLPAPRPETPRPASAPSITVATDAGPRPYAIAFKAEPARPTAMAAPPPVSPTSPASPTATPGAAASAPRPYAVAFLNEPGAPPQPPVVAAAARKPAAAPRPGSLVLLDASGQPDRVRNLKTRLTQLGWSAGASVPQVAPAATRTVVRFPEWRSRVAQALARTLPGPTQLQSCGRTCNFIQVLFGADVRHWRFAPGRLDAHQGARLNQ
jgi:hypothetical protein